MAKLKSMKGSRSICSSQKCQDINIHMYFYLATTSCKYYSKILKKVSQINALDFHSTLEVYIPLYT